jgi:porin
MSPSPFSRPFALVRRAGWASLGFALVAGQLAAAANDDRGIVPSAIEGPVNLWWEGSSIIPQIDVRDWPVTRLGAPHPHSVIPSSKFRQDLADDGVSFFGSYTAYFLGNVSGGLSQQFAYNSMLFFQLNLDLEKLVGWQGGKIVWSWADNNGSNLSQTVGNNFQISTDYGPNSFIFNEFYFRQSLLDEALQIKIGQLSMLNSFAASELYSYYANLAFCGNPISLSFNSGATAMPASSWGIHVEYTQPSWYVQAAVYQLSDRIGVIAYHGLNYAIEPDDGAIVFAETGWTPFFGKTADAAGYPGNYKFGAFYSGWNYENYNGGANTSNLYGFYWLADQMVYQEPGNPAEGLYLWSGFTLAPQQDMAQLPYFVSGGVQYQGLLPHRSLDRTVFGMAYGSYSGDLRAQQRSQGQSPEYYEMVFEWTYQIAVNKWMTIQPDVQYIVNPGATGTIPNAWVIGAIVNVNF